MGRRRGRDPRALAVGAAIVLGAWAMRGACPGHGLPVIDAPENWVGTFVSLDRASGSNPWDAVARGVHWALLHVQYLLCFALLRLEGSVANFEQFATEMVQDPSLFWTLARSTTALLGAATVGLLYVHGRQLGGARQGALAALFLAVSVGHVETSRRVTPDAALVLITFGALSLIAGAAQRRRAVGTVVFALTCGAALRAGWTGVLLLAPYLVGNWASGGARGLVSPRRALPLIAAFGLAGVAALLSSGDDGWVGAGMEFGAGPSGTGRGLLLALGWGPVALAILGTGFALRGGPPGLRLHALYLVLTVVALLTGPPGVEAAGAVLLPSACLLAAFALEELARRLETSGVLETGVVVATATLCVIEPAIAAGRFTRRDCAADTRQLAAEWILEHVEPLTPVAVPVDPRCPWESTIPIPDLKQNLKERLSYIRTENPRQVRYWEVALKARPARRLPLHLVEGPHAWESAAAYQERGIRYAVLPLSSHSGRFSVSAPALRLRSELREMAGAELRASFGEDGELTRGPWLEIWQIEPNEAREGSRAADESETASGTVGSRQRS